MNQADYDVAKKMQAYAEWCSKPDNAEAQGVDAEAMKAEADRQGARADSLAAGGGTVIGVTFASDVVGPKK